MMAARMVAPPRAGTRSEEDAEDEERDEGEDYVP
jgi:hypothetical protein